MISIRRSLPLTVAAATVALSTAPAAVARAASPTVSTGAAIAITFSSADLTGAINPRGVETVVSFQYGPTHALGTSTPVTPLGNGRTPVDYGVAVSGLTPATKYYFRIVATGSGTAEGVIRSFTTPAIPLTVTLATTPNPVVFGDPFVVEGTLAGTGSANHEVVLQANPFPYTGGFFTIGNAEVTSPTGSFQFPFLGLEQTAQVRVTTLDPKPVVSQVVTEGVAVRVTLQISPTRHAGVDRLSGTVSPPEPGALVGYERLKPHNRFVTVSGGLLGGSGTRFSKVLKVVRRGVYRVLIQTSGGPQLSNVSPSISLR